MVWQDSVSCWDCHRNQAVCLVQNMVRWCMSHGVHMNARTQGFPAEHCIVTGWSKLPISGFDVVADWCCRIGLAQWRVTQPILNWLKYSNELQSWHSNILANCMTLGDFILVQNPDHHVHPCSGYHIWVWLGNVDVGVWGLDEVQYGAGSGLS